MTQFDCEYGVNCARCICIKLNSWSKEEYIELKVYCSSSYRLRMLKACDVKI